MAWPVCFDAACQWFLSTRIPSLAEDQPLLECACQSVIEINVPVALESALQDALPLAKHHRSIQAQHGHPAEMEGGEEGVVTLAVLPHWKNR